MVKHTYFSIESSILKHPVVTVVKKRRKELNYGQEGIKSNVPQVAPRTTREDPTSTAISLTQFFFQCRVPETCFPRKGRSEGDASTK